MDIKFRRIIDWFDSRFGMTETILRPGPDYSINLFYWLGALMVVAFIVQGVTGLLMLLYYVPTVEQAYSSTLFIIKYVPLGRLIETIHLYSAYAMVLLAFAHLMRGYFASVQKKPRELMWIVGMLMGFVVLGFGLTGYLLPWTVISKSATDVTIGMLGFLPSELANVLRFLIAGPGSDAAELSRFFDLHVVVLPAIFTILLAAKMYMFEIHGASEPSTGVKKKVRSIPWFPNIFLYFTMLSCVFLFILLVGSVLFPLALPAQFTPSAASAFVPQPEWYFLWIYQILKFSAFEGAWAVLPLVGITAFFLVLLLLPFIDKSKKRNPAHRPVYVTLGLVFVFEVIVLGVWGYFTPGQVIPNTQALVIMVGIPLVISILSWITYRTRRTFQSAGSRSGSIFRFVATPFKAPLLTGLFVLLLTSCSIPLAFAVNLMASPWSNIPLLVSSVLITALLLYLMSRIVKKLAAEHPVMGARHEA
jgi:quinol-cytochrome oxidoreductase complex cytochrome b subunit